MSVAAGTAVRARRSSRADGRRGYFDPKFDRFAIKVHPGEHYLTAQKDEMLVTVLGSCVSACIRDPGTGFGGMNHFMLPESDTGQWGASSAAMRYGNHAMEMLINAVISSGCPRHRLEIKLFGGSNVTGGTSGIGDQNAEFILRYMKIVGTSPMWSRASGERSQIHPWAATSNCSVRSPPNAETEGPRSDC